MRVFNGLRKPDISGMMRSALADRIIESIRALRRAIKCNTLFAKSKFCRPTASYFLVLLLALTGWYVVSSSGLVLPFCIGFFQLTLDSFRGDATEKNPQVLKEEQKSSIIERKTVSEGKQNILRFLYPSVSRLELLAGNCGCGVAAYLRVSSVRQAKDGESLEAQEAQAREIALKIGTPRIFWVIDAGKSVKDFNSKKLNHVLELAANGKIDKVIIREIDRVGRKSLKLLGFLIQLRGHGVTIVTPSGELDIEKLTDFVVTSFKAFSAEDENRKRASSSLQSKVRAFRNRKWKIPVPLGYIESSGWVKKSSDWAPIMIDIYDLFLKLRNFESVTNIINKKSKDLLDRLMNKSLTRQQVSRILQNPVCVGKPTFSGKAIEKEFGIVVVEDPELRFVSEEKSEKARQIISAKRGKYMRRKKDLDELIENCGVEILDFLPQVAVLCPICEGIMKDNGGSKYVCQKCEHQMLKPKKKEIEKIREWAFKREKSLKTIFRILNRYKGEAEKIDDLSLNLKEIEGAV